MVAEVVARRAGRCRAPPAICAAAVGEPRRRLLHELALRRLPRPPGRPRRRSIRPDATTRASAAPCPRRCWRRAAERILRRRARRRRSSCGAEALDTKRRAKKAGERLAWSHRDPEPPPFPFEAPFHPSEVAHEVFQAWLTFAVRDVARRAHLGVAPDDYRDRIGRPARADDRRSRRPTRTRGSRRRTTAERAHHRDARQPHGRLPLHEDDDVDHGRRHGRRRWCWPATRRPIASVCPSTAASTCGGGPIRHDAVYVAEHPDLWRSPAMAVVLRARRSRSAGVGRRRLAHLDLYSCFSSSVHFAADALGIDPLTDGRGVTVTGGLPYAGGAASNYLAHAVATMADVLRERSRLARAGDRRRHAHDQAQRGRVLDEPRERRPMPPAPWPEPATVPITDTWSGPATVATYSVVHGRDGCSRVGPRRGRSARREPRLRAGRRRPACWPRLEAEEWVGRHRAVRAHRRASTASPRSPAPPAHPGSWASVYALLHRPRCPVSRRVEVGRGSRGSPSTRSATMFLLTSVVPPAIDSDRALTAV